MIPRPHFQASSLVAQSLEASPCLPRMAPPHVPNIAVESFEEVEDDKGLEANLCIFENTIVIFIMTELDKNRNRLIALLGNCAKVLSFRKDATMRYAMERSKDK